MVGADEHVAPATRLFRSRGIEASVASTGFDALVQFGRHLPEVVVVSGAMEDVSAPDLVATMVRHGDPVIVAIVEADDHTLAGRLVLAGARSVVALPCDGDRLWAALGPAEHLRSRARVEHGSIHLDPDSYAVWVDGVRIADPPAKEFELLQALVARAPHLITDDELRETVWRASTPVPSDNTIAVHVARLRHRLEGAAQIRRVRGRGYVLSTPLSPGRTERSA